MRTEKIVVYTLLALIALPLAACDSEEVTGVGNDYEILTDNLVLPTPVRDEINLNVNSIDWNAITFWGTENPRPEVTFSIADTTVAALYSKSTTMDVMRCETSCGAHYDVMVQVIGKKRGTTTGTFKYKNSTRTFKIYVGV